VRGADKVVAHEGDSTSYSAPREPARSKEAGDGDAARIPASGDTR